MRLYLSKGYNTPSKTLPLNHSTSWIGNPATGQCTTNGFPSTALITLGNDLSGELIGDP